jgi:hypothetical protein
VQEIQIQRKHKVSPNTNGTEVQQETERQMKKEEKERIEDELTE